MGCASGDPAEGVVRFHLDGLQAGSPLNTNLRELVYKWRGGREGTRSADTYGRDRGDRKERWSRQKDIRTLSDQI